MQRAADQLLFVGLGIWLVFLGLCSNLWHSKARLLHSCCDVSVVVLYLSNPLEGTNDRDTVKLLYISQKEIVKLLFLLHEPVDYT